ncbi:MAG: isoleucine--tRNA ligase, partial [Bacteroidales bacterium]|nr:isoleucine--tRNA ligase [Bacteroidales bacterium]
FFMEKLFLDLNGVTGKEAVESIHHSDYPAVHEEYIDKSLEERMQLAQLISSMVLSLRKKSNIKVRQPLSRIMLPADSSEFKSQIDKVKNLILHEVNVKNIEFIEDGAGILVKRIKPDFKKLGPKYGKIMKSIAAAITSFDQKQISALEKEGKTTINVEGTDVEILDTDVEIFAEDIPGWVVTNQGAITVALDITISEELKQEGYAREFVNKIQNFRKELQFDVVDRIVIELHSNPDLDAAFRNFEEYIKSETLCAELRIVDEVNGENRTFIDITPEITAEVSLEKFDK